MAASLEERLIAEDLTLDIDDEPEPDDEFANDPAKAKVQKILKALWFQGALMVLVLADIVLLVWALIKFEEWIPETAFAFVCVFLIEIVLRMWLQGFKKFFFAGRNWWHLVEFGVMMISFIIDVIDIVLTLQQKANGEEFHPENVTLFEVAAVPVVVLRTIRLVILVRARSDEAKKYTRRFVSADRRRYRLNGFDLDLTYIRPNIIAMSWPSTQVEALYRNNIKDVARFMDTMHADHYRVYPLCSERAYDPTHFHENVRRFKMDDHNPCDLGMMVDFVIEVKKWLSQDEKNIAVIHCKGGKGRTGTMICSWLLYSGACPTAEVALREFGQARSSDGAAKIQGVESPSQERYVGHFEKLIALNKNIDLHGWDDAIARRTVALQKVVLLARPLCVSDPHQLWFSVVAGSKNEVLYQSVFHDDVPMRESNRYNPLGSAASQVVGGGFNQVRRSSRTRFGSAGDQKFDQRGSSLVVEYRTPKCPPLQGDLHVQFYYLVKKSGPFEKPKQKVLFEFWLHVFFLEEKVITLTRRDIDGPHKDKKGLLFGPDFSLELYFDFHDATKDDEKK